MQTSLNYAAETPDIVKSAFVKAGRALRNLSKLGFETYAPPELDTAREMTEHERMYRDIAETLAWGLRIADSFSVVSVITSICTAIAANPRFELYVAYSFLSDAYEIESVLKLDGYALNPLTSAMKSYALSVIVEQLPNIRSRTEVAWVVWLLNRIIAWLPFSPTPETYINLDNADAIYKAIDQRRQQAPDTIWEKHGTLKAIEQTRGLIERYRLEQKDQ